MLARRALRLFQLLDVFAVLNYFSLVETTLVAGSLDKARQILTLSSVANTDTVCLTYFASTEYRLPSKQAYGVLPIRTSLRSYTTNSASAAFSKYCFSCSNASRTVSFSSCTQRRSAASPRHHWRACLFKSSRSFHLRAGQNELRANLYCPLYSSLLRRLRYFHGHWFVSVVCCQS